MKSQITSLDEKLQEETKNNPAVAKEEAEEGEVEDPDLEEGEIAGPEEAEDPDERSCFVKNVDFSINEEMLTEHFKECGEIERVTIRKNNQTGQSLGLCYLQFMRKESAV